MMGTTCAGVPYPRNVAGELYSMTLSELKTHKFCSTVGALLKNNSLW